MNRIPFVQIHEKVYAGLVRTLDAKSQAVSGNGGVVRLAAAHKALEANGSDS
jgi:hypothetical protein